MYQKLVPDPILILVNQNSHCMQEVLLKIILKEGYQKALEKLALIFLLNPVPFKGQDYKKQKGPGTSDQWLGRLPNKFRKIPFLVMAEDKQLQVRLQVVNFRQSSRCYFTCILCHLFWNEISLMTNKHKKSESNFNYIGLSNISACDGRTLCLQQRAVILPHILSLFYNFV